MSRNIHQVYIDNPSTTLASGDLIYTGKTPFGVNSDSAISFSDFFAFAIRPSVYPEYYINGFNLSWINVSTVQLSGGVVKAIGSTSDTFSLSTLNIDISTSGAGGLDTGSVAGDETYAVYVIWDSTLVQPTKGLCSLGFPAPTSLPAGYNNYRRVGWIMTNNSADIFLFSQVGLYNQRKYFYQDIFGAVPASGGKRLFTGVGNGIFTVDCTGLIPPFCSEVGVLGSLSGVAGAIMQLQNFNFSNANVLFTAPINSIVAYQQFNIDLSSTTLKFYVTITDASDTVVSNVDLNYFVDYV